MPNCTWYENKLVSWKRNSIFPLHVQANPELAAIWAVGQRIWQRDFPGIYTAIAAFQWSENILPVMEALGGKKSNPFSPSINMLNISQPLRVKFLRNTSRCLWSGLFTFAFHVSSSWFWATSAGGITSVHFPAWGNPWAIVDHCAFQCNFSSFYSKIHSYKWKCESTWKLVVM